MKEADKKLVQDFARSVRALFPDAAIWIFGSRARGDAVPESDLDCLIVLDHLSPQADRAIRDIAWEIGFESGVVITTVILERKEFEQGPMSESSIVANILREGARA